ncbi:MAG: hypothetical protein LQ338_000625 [Usnochroma carphineum]|nr:MAG: hypothetical protein LQ338_000625 [Usnochroma carphineum]
MNAFNAHPPIRHHSSERIPPTEAQQLLAEFLEEAATNPSLHANALLTEDGPVARSSSMGLVLHNLKRVEAGLRGEHLAADLSLKDFGGEGLLDPMDEVVRNGGFNVETSKDQPGRNQEAGWQDKEEYEREQAVEQGEIGRRNNALGNPDIDKGPSNGSGKVPAVKPAEGASKLNKEERKRGKKEIRDQKRREREKQLARDRRS